jgi:parvulin-like peptidyl-prolyl isomerase
MSRGIPTLAIVAFVAVAASSVAPADESPAVDLSIPVATYGDHTITVGDMVAQINVVKKQRGLEVDPDPDTFYQMAGELLILRVLADQAREAKLDQDPELAARLRLNADRLLARAEIDAVLDAQEAPDYELVARETYLAEKEKFVTKERIHARHILVDTKGRSVEDAKKLAEELRTKALADPSAFGALASEHSDDRVSAMKGGDLGWTDRDKLAKPFGDAAVAMTEENQISDVVETQFGYHIIQLLGHEPPKQVPFEDIKEELARQAESAYRKEKIQRLMADIRNSPDKKLNDKAYAELYPDAPAKPQPAPESAKP